MEVHRAASAAVTPADRRPPPGEGSAGPGPRAVRGGRSCSDPGSAAPLPIPTERHVHNGGPVISREDLIRELGLGRSTAEAWYRNRATNGHPEPVLIVGRQLYFDEHDLIAWARARQAPPAERITRDGRVLVTRVELSRLTGLSVSALATLYSQRAGSGHPEVSHRDGRTLYFDEADALEWHQARRAHSAAGLAPVDRIGGPDELVDRAAAAKLLGYSGPKVIDSYRARNPGSFPEPDATEPLRWRRATLWTFADGRSTSGAQRSAASRKTAASG